jgi:hypothetical protein
VNLKRDLWIVLVTVIAITFWSIQLTKKVTQIHSNDLYKLDSIRLLSRAFTNGPAKSNRPNEIEFEDETRKLFKISGSRFSASSPSLYDKLQYSELVMTILTDKKGYSDYLNSRDKNPIQVYNIIIDSVSYIDIEGINNSENSKRSTSFIATFIIYCIILTFYFYYRNKE